MNVGMPQGHENRSYAGWRQQYPSLYTVLYISQCFAKFIEKYALTGNMSMRGICPGGRRRGSIIDSLQEAPGAIQGYAKVAALTRPCLSSLAKENMAALSGKAK